MSNFGVGYFIRIKREEQQYSQEKLSHGICSEKTLFRIEHGQMPGYFILSGLLQRLGFSEKECRLFLSEDEFKLVEQKREIIADNTNGNYLRAIEKIRKLEENPKTADNRFIQQFILRSKAIAGYEKDGEHAAYDSKTQRDMLVQALEMTSPHIRQSPACNFLFGEEEIKIINQIANSYSEEGNRLKAMEIYHYLFNYIKSHIMDGDILAVTLPLVAYNYSKCLGLEHCYDEAIDVAEQGRRCCIRNNKCQMLGGLLLNLGCVYHDKGDEEKSKDFIQRSYQMYREMERVRSCKVVKDYARETWGIELS